MIKDLSKQLEQLNIKSILQNKSKNIIKGIWQYFEYSYINDDECAYINNTYNNNKLEYHLKFIIDNDYLGFSYTEYDNYWLVKYVDYKKKETVKKTYDRVPPVSSHIPYIPPVWQNYDNTFIST